MGLTIETVPRGLFSIEVKGHIYVMGLLVLW